MIDKWLQNIQSVILPSVCVLCGDPGSDGQDLCPACRSELPANSPACSRCAEPLTTEIHASLCGRCQTQPPAYERCLAPFRYDPPLDHLLQGLKFHGRLALARSLGELMAAWLEDRVDSLPDRLLPVPLHPSRLRQRGFNQALELARPIARRLDLSLDVDSCRRRLDTTPQADLSARLRHKNIRGAFEVLRPQAGHVVIIDDVMTTGSTAHELGKVLLKAGAKKVEVWVCARAG